MNDEMLSKQILSWSFLSLQETPLSLSDIRGSGGAPPRGCAGFDVSSAERKGKAPPLIETRITPSAARITSSSMSSYSMQPPLPKVADWTGEDETWGGF